MKVTSQAMTDIAYDAATLTLRIRFTDGDWYSYTQVPAAIAEALTTADSHGRYFRDRIRDRYAYRRG